MTASKSLPPRPSLEFLRKQAKKPAAQLPHVAPPLSQRGAQLVLAREYGFAGRHDHTAEVSQRLGSGLEWAAALAQAEVHRPLL